MIEVPIWNKVALTIQEAAAYSNIGINTLNDIINSSECNFIFYIGKKRLIKRQLFDEYILKIHEIKTNGQ